MKTNDSKICNVSVNDRDGVLSAIAGKILGIETLETRNSDRLDFYDLGVASVRRALAEAYAAGRVAAANDSAH